MHHTMVVNQRVTLLYGKHTPGQFSLSPFADSIPGSLQFIVGISNPEQTSCRFQLRPQLNAPKVANQGVQGYLIITDRWVGTRAVVKSTFVESKTSPSPKRFESESSPSPKRFESKSSPSPKRFESKSKSKSK